MRLIKQIITEWKVKRLVRRKMDDIKSEIIKNATNFEFGDMAGLEPIVNDSTEARNYEGDPVKAGFPPLSKSGYKPGELEAMVGASIGYPAINFKGKQIMLEKHADGSVTLCKEVVDDIVSSSTTPAWIKELLCPTAEFVRIGETIRKRPRRQGNLRNIH